MAQIIEIKIQKKIAKTDFSEVVSHNNVYRLKFVFDEEWAEYPHRVAVVYWEGGGAEVLFTENECDMPQINSLFSENVYVGVYSIQDGKRIASSFVPIRCLPGAYKAPPAKKTDSLQEQVLDMLNKFGDPHKFVTVDTEQTVTGQKTFTENLMVGSLEGGVELNPTLGAIVRLSDNTSKPIKLPNKMGTFALTDDIPDLTDLKQQSGSALQPGDVTVAYTPMGERDRKTFRLAKGAQVEFHGFDSELIDDDFLSIEGTRLKAEGYTTFQSGDITLIGGQNIGISQEGNKITFVGADIPDISGLAEKTQVQEVESAAQKAQETADSAKTAAQTAQTTAEKAQETADSAKTAAQKAQSTADSANSAAKTAQSTADSAKTAAQNAQSSANASLQPEDVTVIAEQDPGNLNLPLKKGTRIFLHGFSADLVSDNALSIDGTRLKASETSQDPIGGDITLKGDGIIRISQVAKEFVFSAYLPENHVTTDTEQTITSRKTFSEPLTVGNYDTNAIVIDSTGIQVCSDGTCSYLTLPKKFDTVATLGDIPDISGLAEKTEVKKVETAAQTAQSSADSANTAAQKAQSTADSAKSAAQTAQSTADSANTAAQTAQSSADSANSAAQKAQETADSANTAAKASLQPEDVEISLSNSNVKSFNTALGKGTSLEFNGFDFDHEESASRKTINIQGTRVKANGSPSGFLSGDITLKGSGITIAQAGKEITFTASAPPVTSVNTKTGAVTLGKGDVGLGNVANERQYSAEFPPPWSKITGTENVALKTDIPTIPKNYVTTDTEQTITGQKTFTENLLVGGNVAGIEFNPALRAIVLYSENVGKPMKLPDKMGTFALTSDIPSVPTDKDIFLKAHPVGSYYISSEKTSPKDLFGGSWTAITGRFLYCNAGTGTGGSNSVTLTVNNLPSHNHSLDSQYFASRRSANNGFGNLMNGDASNDPDMNYGLPFYHSSEIIKNTGGGQAFNNMPAYQTVYAWRRTA